MSNRKATFELQCSAQEAEALTLIVLALAAEGLPPTVGELAAAARRLSSYNMSVYQMRRVLKSLITTGRASEVKREVGQRTITCYSRSELTVCAAAAAVYMLPALKKNGDGANVREALYAAAAAAHTAIFPS